MQRHRIAAVVVRRMNVMLTVAENHARSLRTQLNSSTPDDRGGIRKREEPISRAIRQAHDTVSVG